MKKGLFITATDTEVGKTVITGALACAFKARGFCIGAVKPVASGGVLNKYGNLEAEDATFIMKASGIPESRRPEVSPICLAPALTPAVAALESGVVIDVQALLTACRNMVAKSEITLIEGVGGIAAPIWQDWLVADMMRELCLPAIIVARPNLGAINHAVLTAEYARHRGLDVIGFIINSWKEHEVTVLERSNLEYIERLSGLPILGRFPYVNAVSVPDGQTGNIAELAEMHIDIDYILRHLGGI